MSNGGLHTCALRASGTLWCWGANNAGQDGDGTFTDRDVPTQVGTDANWALVRAGGNHTCAIRTDGTLWCWGANGSGELGIATSTLSPIEVSMSAVLSPVRASARFRTRCQRCVVLPIIFNASTSFRVLRTLGTRPFFGRKLLVGEAAKSFDAAGQLTDERVRGELTHYLADFATFIAR